MLSIIVAKSINNAIGKDNKLLWKIPDDMKRFKEITTGHTVIMGRKTFESIGKVLPNRLNIILTRDPNYKIDDPNVKILGGVSDLEEYISDENENFVIGGAQIYSILMPRCKKLYVTQVDKDFVGDTYFPGFVSTLAGVGAFCTEFNMFFILSDTFSSPTLSIYLFKKSYASSPSIVSTTSIICKSKSSSSISKFCTSSNKSIDLSNSFASIHFLASCIFV